MATFIFNGEQGVVFPTIALTVQPGDFFDAPDDFVAEGVTASKKAKSAPATIEVTPVEEGQI